MELFIDTSNSKFIIALINNNKVVDFKMLETNKNMAKNANKWIDAFLNKHNIHISEIIGFLTVVGPGSFTGVKVSANIINTLHHLYPKTIIKVIDSFTLLKDKKRKFIAIPFGKGKYYLKYNNPFIPGYKTVQELPKRGEGVIGYSIFDSTKLENKLTEFKLTEKVIPIYPKLKFK